MKGQLNLEQIVAMTLFIAFSSYVFFTVFNLVPRYTSEVRSERLRSEAYQMSELLINDPGSPANWDKSVKPSRLGLSDETANLTNFISKSKVAALAGNCSAPNYAGFSQVGQWLGTDRQFSLLILSRNCAITGVDCRPNASVFRSSPINISIRRFVAFDNTCYGELDMEVW
ncbi:MAG: hypothetical protein J4452_00410 [Candidatus Aenigmarchaeota archaeon]|nr:hypothetical protein [Candidatus Aenigmarchaeota archaeon]